MSESKQGWWIVLGGFFTLMFTAGIGYFVFGIFLESILVETKWGLTEVSIAIMLWGIIGAVVSPFVGRWIDRSGARPVMLCGTALQFVVIMLLARVDALWQLYAVMMLSSVASVCNTYIPVAAVVALWFQKNRGTATGLAMLGLGLAGIVMPQLSQYLLADHTWRESYTILGYVVLGAFLPILLWIRNPTEQLESSNEASFDESVPGGAADPVHDITVGEAFSTRSFWGISLGDALTGLIFAIFNIQLVLFITEDYGSDKMATNVYSTMLFFTAVGTVIFGLSADRMPVRKVMIGCYCMPAIATLFLLPSAGIALAFTFAIIVGLAGGGRQALFPLALVHSFGQTHVGAIYGLSNSFFLVGNAIGPVVGGVLYETYDSTRPVYVVAVVMFIFSAILISLMRNERRGAREADSTATPPA